MYRESCTYNIEKGERAKPAPGHGEGFPETVAFKLGLEQ